MKLTCKVYNLEQGSEAWKSTRRNLFTASEVKGPFLVAEKPTKAQVDARKNLIRKKAQLQTKEGLLIEEEENRKTGYSIDVKRGNQLEPEARTSYAKLTGSEVVEIGFCAHELCQFDDDGNPLSGFGCSPDGLIQDGEEWIRGVEIKCARPATLMEWIDDGRLPDEHASQVHFSMAVTGLRQWDFFAYAQELPPLLVEVAWNETTDRMLAALKSLHADFLEYRKKLGRMKPVIIKVPVAQLIGGAP